MERNSRFREQLIWRILNVCFRTRWIASQNHSLCLSLFAIKTIWIINWDRVYTAVIYFGYDEFHPESPVWLQYQYWSLLSILRCWEGTQENRHSTASLACLLVYSIPPVALKELQVSTNCTTRDQFNSNKPIMNCRGNLATNFSPKQLLASKLSQN